MAADNSLTHEQLLKLLHYSPDTGVFTWKIDRSRGRGRGHVYIKAGEVAGTINQGRLLIGVCGRRYFAHVLAWFYVTGTWPADEIDHRDTNALNNRWSNLREVDRAMNMQNLQRAKKNNRSTGLLGVSKNRHYAGFRARITVGRKEIWLGSFPTKEDAYAAYLKAKRDMHPGCLI